VPAAPASLEPAQKRFAPDLIGYHSADHPLSEQYRALLHAILSQWLHGGTQVLLLGAASAGTGTTTVLLNLAITAARQNKKRVAVVDANLRRPAVAERMGLPSVPGLTDVLAGRMPLQRALQETGQSHLVALPAGGCSGDQAWPPGDALRPLIRQMRKLFDLVLIDGPSLDGGPEIVPLGSACDCLYLVLPPDAVDSTAVTDMNRLLPLVGSYLGGYILLKR
jgi:Mrp family chromosome partitioning ATPase